jgi:hypothetical protein
VVALMTEIPELLPGKETLWFCMYKYLDIMQAANPLHTLTHVCVLLNGLAFESHHHSAAATCSIIFLRLITERAIAINMSFLKL